MMHSKETLFLSFTRFGCMGSIARGDADVMNVDPEDLYLAGSIFGLEPFLMEEYDRSRLLWNYCN